MSGLKGSTIKKILTKKIKGIAETIENETVKGIFLQNVIVTGGAIPSMLLDEKVNDYDIYFKTKEAAFKVAEYYVKVFNEIKGELKTTALHSCNPEVRETTIKNIKGEEENRIVIWMQSSGIAAENQEEYHYFEAMEESATEKFFNSVSKDPLTEAENVKEDLKSKKKYRPVFLSDNAITLSDKVQIVIRFFGTPEEIHYSYDFAHCMCYYDYIANELILPQESLECILSKTLIYKGSLYPVASIFRIRKFIERGWRITAGQMLKIIWQLQDVNLRDPEVLREQLIGVDQAYMWQLIRAIESAEIKVDSTYLAKLIDEIFE